MRFPVHFRWRNRIPAPIPESDNTPAPEVCPEEPKSVSEWAVEELLFTPSEKQAEVLNTAANKLIVNCSRQWGKTTTIAIKALHYALHNPGANIVVLSRSKTQAGLLVEKVADFVSVLGIRRRRAAGQDRSIELPNRSRIVAIAHTGDTSRGRTANILIVDEAGIVSDQVFAAVAPFVSRTGGAIWLLSTPSGEQGFFYHFWHTTDQQWVKIKSTVDDCPEINREALELQKQLCPTTFRQEYYCEFLPKPGRLFTREMVQSLIDTTIPPYFFTL